MNEAWTQKEKIRGDPQHVHLPYTRIERAYVANSVSMTTEIEMEQDEVTEMEAAIALRSEIENIDKAQLVTTDTTTVNIVQDDANGKALTTAPIPTSDSLNIQAQMIAQQNMIEQLTREIEELSKECQTSSASVHTDLSTVVAGQVNTTAPPKVIETTANNTETSYTMLALLDKYETLDETSKNELLQYAIFSGNKNLQS